MNKASITISQANLAHSKKFLDLGNTLFYLNNIKNIEFAAEHYRQALFKNPYSYEAIVMLAKCFKRGANIQIIDAIDTRLGGYQRGKEMNRSDLLGLDVQLQDGQIDRSEVIIEFFRKARFIDPHFMDATWNLVAYLTQKKMPICDRDRQGTRFEGKSFPIRANELVAELLRIVILNQPYRSSAIIKLAICISNGANIVEQDLKDTPYADYPLESVEPQQLEAALYEKAIKINP